MGKMLETSRVTCQSDNVSMFNMDITWEEPKLESENVNVTGLAYSSTVHTNTLE